MSIVHYHSGCLRDLMTKRKKKRFCNNKALKTHNKKMKFMLERENILPVVEWGGG